MATDSREICPVTNSTDMPSGRLIIARDDDALEYRGDSEISVDRGFKSLRPHTAFKETAFPEPPVRNHSGGSWTEGPRYGQSPRASFAFPIRVSATT